MKDTYYVEDNVIEPIGRDYVFSELISPIFIKDGDNVKVLVAVNSLTIIQRQCRYHNMSLYFIKTATRRLLIKEKNRRVFLL